MNRYVLWATVLSIGLSVMTLAQDTPRHDKYASDKDAYCWNPKSSGTQGPRRERDPHAHKCACHLLCETLPSGEVVGDHEDRGCELYCTRSRCSCHQGEEPCEGH